MTTALISPLPIQAFLDNNGKQAVGAQLFTYAAGTTTKQPTYTSSSGATPNTNPVVLNARGEAMVWLSPGIAYKFVLAPSTDTNPPTNPYWSVDNIVSSSGLVSVGGATGVILLGGGLSISGQTLSGTIPRSYLSGLGLATAGSSATFSIAPGQATDSTNISVMALPTSYTKTTAAWVIGTAMGSLDTGAIANNTWYHVFLIQRTDTGVVDILISLSATSPLLPAFYTIFRRIGSMKTDGSAHWTAFIQNGDTFLWLVAFADFGGAGPTTSTLFTLTTPPGVKTVAITNVVAYNVGGSGVGYGLAFSPDQTPVTASISDANFSWISSDSAASATINVWTDISSNIYVSTSGWSGGVFTLNLLTQGWVDRRGRDN